MAEQDSTHFDWCQSFHCLDLEVIDPDLPLRACPPVRHQQVIDAVASCVFDSAEIVRRAVPYAGGVFPYGGAVYFLVDDDLITYVGQSTQPEHRMWQHRGVKEFTRVWAICGLPRYVLDHLETAYIKAWMPADNGKVPPTHIDLHSHVLEELAGLDSAVMDERVIERPVTFTSSWGSMDPTA